MYLKSNLGRCSMQHRPGLICKLPLVHNRSVWTAEAGRHFKYQPESYEEREAEVCSIRSRNRAGLMEVAIGRQAVV